MDAEFLTRAMGDAASGRVLATSECNAETQRRGERDEASAPLRLRVENTNAPSQGLPFAAEDGPAWGGDEQTDLPTPDGVREMGGRPSPAAAARGDTRPPGTVSRVSGEQIRVPSPAALAVLDAGRALWRHYHAQPGGLPDASF